MNRSFSKLRHIQNVNLILERRVISEGQEGKTTKSYDFGICSVKSGETIKNDSDIIRVNCTDDQQVVYDCKGKLYGKPLYVLPERGSFPVESSKKITNDQGLKGVMSSFC